VFGQVKQARGLRQFLLRGIDKVRAEWPLMRLTNNPLKPHRASAVAIRPLTPALSPGGGEGEFL
jgi:hypothetical protein